MITPRPLPAPVGATVIRWLSPRYHNGSPAGAWSLTGTKPNPPRRDEFQPSRIPPLGRGGRLHMSVLLGGLLLEEIRRGGDSFPPRGTSLLLPGPGVR